MRLKEHLPIMRSAALAMVLMMATAAPAFGQGAEEEVSCPPANPQSVSPSVDVLAYLRPDDVRFPKQSQLRCLVSNRRIIGCAPDSIYLERLAQALIGREVTGFDGQQTCISFRVLLAD
jgi:hypothetical protein